jgi:hypothetical protein
MLRRMFFAAAIFLSALAGAVCAQDDYPRLVADHGNGDSDGRRRQFDIKWEERWVSGPTYGGLRLLSARVIAGSLTRQGYRDVDIKRLRGSSYIAEAQSPRGNRVLLVVDGRTSEITGRQVIEWQQPRRNWDDGGWWKTGPWSGPRW